MTDYKGKLGTLADKLKNQGPPTPMQEVHPVKVRPDPEEQEARFNNWIPKSLKKELKQYSADTDLSLKEINIQALKDYLKKNRPTGK